MAAARTASAWRLAASAFCWAFAARARSAAWRFFFSLARCRSRAFFSRRRSAAAAAEAAADVHVEVYDGDHGWTVPDSPAYAPAAAERAWEDLLALYGSAL